MGIPFSRQLPLRLLSIEAQQQASNIHDLQPGGEPILPIFSGYHSYRQRSKLKQHGHCHQRVPYDVSSRVELYAEQFAQPDCGRQVALHLARAIVPPPRLRAKRVEISAPLQPGPSRPVSGLWQGMGYMGGLRIPAAWVISAAPAWMAWCSWGISELASQKSVISVITP